MKIGTIIILENLDLQRVISYIGGSLSDRYSSIELFIGDFILEDPKNIIGKCPKYIKIILDKYRSLILQNTSHEVALKEFLASEFFNSSNPIIKYFFCNSGAVA